MQIFRLFVSSPTDAAVERRRVENVVSRLNGEFAALRKAGISNPLKDEIEADFAKPAKPAAVSGDPPESKAPTK
ncbi:hypothetical protein [Rhodoblastus sp.]|uniref:hypothetical protein n=1 Tax=Rhodoblastus sp. TaxID=1962975 RepID=UPI003F9CC348